MTMSGRPELIIGVDFGMSQTGVAYCTAPWNTPVTFQSWSSITAEVYNKTPSRLAYSDGTGALQTWGYFVDLNDGFTNVKEYFKLHLDRDYQDDYQDMTHAEAKRYYRDYLTCIHDHIARFFQARYPQWATMHVEWNFSVPTTWKNAGLVRELQSIMEAAGFGNDGQNHSCLVTLTEAEAAAICGAGQQLQVRTFRTLFERPEITDIVKRDDVILVCDAGGGTTDVNIMKVKSDRGEALRLEQLRQVEGQPIGSALIDIRVQQHLAERLELVQDYLPAPAPKIAERMMLGKFERFKCSFGSPASTVPRIYLPVPGLQAGVDLPRPGIRNSQIEITHETIKPIFDEQADGLIALIEDQLHGLQRKYPGELVSYLILSGGLAASEYIQSRLNSHFSGRGGAIIPNARSMRLILAESMQLAVVQGLVRFRAQQIGQHINPIVHRCAPVSYGVVVNQRYDPRRHLGERVTRDTRDKKRWAIDQIEWLIHKGDRVKDEGIQKQFKAKLRPAQRRRPWRAQFVLSTEPEERLPQSMASKDLVRTICVMTVNIESTERVVRNKHWWNMGERYELARFAIKLIPGHADLSFRLLSGGRVLNGEDDRVEVNWGAAASPQLFQSGDDLGQLFLE